MGKLYSPTKNSSLIVIFLIVYVVRLYEWGHLGIASLYSHMTS